MFDCVEVVRLFIAWTRDEAGALERLADYLAQTGHPLAPLAHKLANAVPDIPADIATQTEPHTLASGTGWAIEFIPDDGTPPDSLERMIPDHVMNATVRNVFGSDGHDWRPITDQFSPLIPGGTPLLFPSPIKAEPWIDDTPEWVALAFRVCRLNLLGGLLLAISPASLFPGEGQLWLVGEGALKQRLRYLEQTGVR